MPSWQRLAEMTPTLIALNNDPLLGLRKKICELCMPPAKLLELGCGSGLLAGWFADFGYEVSALDNDSEVLITAKKRLLEENIGLPQFFHGDAFKIVPGMARFAPFAACYSQGLLEHFEDEKILELLKAQTALAHLTIFSVPSENYPRKEKGDERLMPLPAWYSLCENFKETHDITVTYYGDGLHLLGVLRSKKVVNG